MKSDRSQVACIALALSTILFSCGGSSSTNNGQASNTQSIVVNNGPNGNYVNGLFTTVKVCIPGSSTCQTIPGVLVDTGSFGLRLLSSALGTLNGSLPAQKDSNGNPILECAQFVGSVVWGPVKTADVLIGAEKASSLPIQVITAGSVPVPSSCKALGPPEEDLPTLGANGILGIGFFLQDCGSACAVAGSTNPGFYYSCAGSACQVAAETNAQQVQNPVGFFPEDNNGVILHLPAATGTPTLSGSMTFGIETQDNNSLGSARIFRPDSFGNLRTTFKGQTYAGFIDSGSNGYFFLNSSITGLANCSTVGAGFYCPTSPVALSATNQGVSGNSTVNFTIGNASQLFSSSSGSVFPTLGGPDPATFDWGLPFFFGRTIYVAIEGRSTSAGSGPYWAY